MLTQFIRVFKGLEDITDPANPVITLKDFSMDNAESSGIALDAKYTYLGKKFPFNNFFLLMKKFNTANSVINIEYWNGADKWVKAVDVLDFTRGLKKNGAVQFQLSNKSSWDEIVETDNVEGNIPKELLNLNINDCYWLRFYFTPAPSNTVEIPDDPETPEDETETVVSNVEIKRITYAFTTTEKVNAVDTQAPRHYKSFGADKNDWLDEILVGSEMMIEDMKTSGLIKSAGQIIELDDFVLPCARRVLMHIYSQMGVAYEDKRGEVSAAYKNFMKGPKTIDKDMDAKIEKREIGTSKSRLIR